MGGFTLKTKGYKKISMIIMSSILAMQVLAACGSNTKEQGNANNKGANSNVEETTSQGAVTEPLMVNQELPQQEILSKGPHGELAVSAKSLQLTVDEVKEIQDLKLTAAISMHYAGNDWSTAQIAGLEDTFAKLGVEVVAVTDAQFKSEKQVSDIETILAKRPDILVSIPVDAVSGSTTYKKAAEAGIKVVFMDNASHGLEPGRDYVSVVSADNYGNGIEAAHIMAEQLNGEGEIGVIFHDADFFVTKQRTEAFEKTITENYPNIKIVERGGIADPSDGETVAAAILTKNPNIDGLFVVWDVPAEGALAAARAANRNDLVITTIDLGTNVAIEIAKDGVIKGLGAQLPYEQGVAEAILAGYAMLGKEAPPYVAVPAVKVTTENVLDAWKLVYNQEAPKVVQDAANK